MAGQVFLTILSMNFTGQIQMNFTCAKKAFGMKCDKLTTSRGKLQHSYADACSDF